MSFMGTPGTVACCMCGVPISPNPSNTCDKCVASLVDVTGGIQKEFVVQRCQKCERFFQPPRQWIKAAPESRELLSWCLKKIKFPSQASSKVKLVDAEFVWTELSLRRIRVKLTVQTTFQFATLQGSCLVTFVIQNKMCLDCNRTTANADVWNSCVQVRQHVSHKRTFFFLEQLIMKHGAHETASKIKSMHEGVDFFFDKKAEAQRFLDFLKTVVPIRSRDGRSLVSHDTKSNSYNYKYTFSVEIAPICKDDLICLPPKLSQHRGGIGPLVLCSRVTQTLQFVDPMTMKTLAIDAATYWRSGFKSVLTRERLVKYVVLDIVPTSTHQGKLCLADATVARETDFGINDQTYSINTTLGHILKPGDVAWGYDLDHTILVNDDLDAHTARGHSIPEVVLVKKFYEKLQKRKRRNQRAKKLKELDMDIDEAPEQDLRDKEAFHQEIKEDEEMQEQAGLALSDGSDVEDGHF